MESDCEWSNKQELLTLSSAPQGIRKFLLFSKSKNVPENIQPLLHVKIVHEASKEEQRRLQWHNLHAEPLKW